MATPLDFLRVEVAFPIDQSSPTPAFVDFTSRAQLAGGGVDITRGRSDAFAQPQPGRCTVTFENTDGALTPGNASSPYWPNVKPQNRMRVTYRDPAVDGNLLSANAASMETDVSDWYSNNAFGTLDPATITSSTTHPQAGTKGALATWPTTTLGSMTMTNVTGLVLGRTYTASAYVWVPIGSPDVRLDVLFLTAGAATATKGALTRISVTFVATQAQHVVGVKAATATSGQQCWFDAVQVDEGSSVRTFTTAPSPIVYRFDGYVDEWPTEWPSGGKELATATITAYDLLSRLGRARSLGSVIEETYRLAGAAWHFPLNEPGDSKTVGDRRGSGSTLSIRQYGTGGELAFADSTGPATDGAGAIKFTAVDQTNGKYLSGTVPNIDTAASAGLTLFAVFATPNLAYSRDIAKLRDPHGAYLSIGVNGSGQAYAAFDDMWNAFQDNVSAGSWHDQATHTIAGRLTLSAPGTYVMRLYVDGVERGTADTFGTWTSLNLMSSTLEIGGTSQVGRQFTGTISHVALFPNDLDVTAIATLHTAVTTGFSGERSDERIARVASWIGLPTGLQSLEVGMSTIGHIDPTGSSPTSYMQLVTQAEDGVVFASTDGKLTFHNRAHATGDPTAAVDITITADQVDPSTRIQNSLTDIVNDVTVSRTGGATFRDVDEASVATYGVLSESVSLPLATDVQAFDRMTWMLNTGSTPVSKLPELGLDGLDPDDGAAIRAIALGDRVAISGMPAQAPTSTVDLRVLGYTEKISDRGWDVQANTAPFLVVKPFIVDDAVYGLLDSGNRITF